MRVMLPKLEMPLPQDGLAILYLLHGFSDNCDSFLQNSSLTRYCEDLPLCIVMPDADKSFYADMRYGGAYWTHISKEVPELIHKTFQISTAPDKIFMGGVSMGGYGAIKMMLQMPCSDVFLFSPVTDIVAVMNNGFVPTDGALSFTQKQLALSNVFDPEHIVGSADDLLTVLRQTNQKLPPLHVYCGRKDFLYADIQVFCNLLHEKKWAYTYTETDGAHCWDTWEENFADMAKFLRRKLLKQTEIPQ